jgi:hypothetical protein
LKTLSVAALAINAATYIAIGIISYLIFPVKFDGVRFWPPVVVPAIFAVFFGPWVGGLGGAIGIFFTDIILGNNPLLSVMAGITSNFALFWIIGYVAQKKTRWIVPTLAYGVVSVFLAWVAYVYTGFYGVGIVVGSYIVFLFFTRLASKWRTYEVGSVIGLIVGSAIIGSMVPLYATLFAPSLAPFSLAGGSSIFIFTFATEIPFLLILGPPIIEAVNRAFPNLRNKENK